MAELRRGTRLALDWGKARIGVAACDPDGILAYPVETVAAGDAPRRLLALIGEYDPLEVIVGLPVDLRGQHSYAADFVRERAVQLAALTDVPLRFADERMSTAAASRRLGQAGRNTRKQRSVIDQAAAVEILQAALEAERAGALGPLVEREDHA